MKKDARMVVVNLRFWTNDLEVINENKKWAACWECGVAKLEPNKSKGILNDKPKPFNSFEDIIPLIREMFRKNKIVVVSKNRRPRIMNPKRKTM